VLPLGKQLKDRHGNIWPGQQPQKPATLH